MRRWYLRMMAAGMLSVGLLAADKGPVGACGFERSAGCPERVAQLAPPTDYRSGLLGPKDRRVQLPSEQWPWSAIGRINVVFGPSYRKICTGTVVGAL